MILHVDLDAFYASVEQRDDPSLRGRPLLVGHDAARAVVLAASYEARRFGCHSAMPMATARRLCPGALIRPPRPEAYAVASRGFREILERFSPLVEPVSIDEAFVDVRGIERLHGPPRAVAQAMREQIAQALELTASVGGGAVKSVAKIASDLCKPDGLLLVAPEEAATARFLAPLPLERLYGVGAKTAGELHALGLNTIGEVARYSEAALERRLGAAGKALHALARGIDPRPVEPDRQAVSIGAEDTFGVDLPDGPLLRRHVLAQADRVAERLRHACLRTETVVLKLKHPDFRVTTRRRTLESATSDGRLLGKIALELLAASAVGPAGVRLSGVAATTLVDADSPRQLGFDEGERRRGEQLGATLDAIRDRFGAGAVQRAELLDDEPNE